MYVRHFLSMFVAVTLMKMKFLIQYTILKICFIKKNILSFCVCIGETIMHRHDILYIRVNN